MHSLSLITMSVTSQELNYLIWRYFQESGLELCTYALQKEANAHLLDEKLESKVTAGALVRLIQKGIQYLEMEAEARRYSMPNGVMTGPADDAYSLLHALTLEEIPLEEEEEKEPPKEVTANGDSKTAAVQSAQVQSAQVQADLGPLPLPLHDLKASTHVFGSQVSCWCPSESSQIIALGTSEDSASILTFERNSKEPKIVSLLHPAASKEERDITALSWNPTGTLLVTATFDGKMRVWTGDGKIRHLLSLHRAPVLVTKWNKPGSLILSVDCTNTVVVWDALTGDIKQHFQGKTSSDEEVLAMDVSNASSMPYSLGNDADWVDTYTYACTGESASIMICKVGEETPLLRFKGHTQGINCIEFDEASQLLASGSDDHTIRIWHGKSPVSIITLVGHRGPVMAVKWIPLNSTELSTLLDPLSAAEGAGSLLASGSIDGTIRIWSPTRGVCLAILALHESPIFICQTSPDGKYLASGGVDGVLVIWDVASIRPDPKPSADRAIARYQPEKEECVNTITWSPNSLKVFVGYASTSVMVDL